MHTARQSPSGPRVLQFAQLSLSANVSFTDGVSRDIPFDTVSIESSDFGAIETVSGLGVFAVPFGFYFVQLELGVDTSPDSMQGIINAISGSTSTVVIQGTEGIATMSLSGNFLRLPTETPISGAFPAAISPEILVVGGGNGNILAADTKMLVWQLAGS